MSAYAVGAASTRTVALLGGTSEIGLAIVAELARKGPVEALLIGRDELALQRASETLRDAGVLSAEITASLRLDAPDAHQALLAEALQGRRVDVAILAVGELGPRDDPLAQIPQALQTLHVNLCGAGSLLLRLCASMRAQGGGDGGGDGGGRSAIIVLSSAAAERARRSNAVYGASKAGLDALAQGLADQLRPAGVRITVVRPGFVRTRMTSGLSPAPLACGPQDVARAAVAGMERGAHTVWAPRAMRFAMLALRMLPRPIFRRLSL